MDTPKRRKSVREEVIRLTAEGKRTRIHFTLKEDVVEAEIDRFDPNPDLVKIGQIDVQRTHFKAYYFKNNPELIFLRIDDCWIPLNKFKWRELMGIITRGAHHLGIMKGKKKRNKKTGQFENVTYRSSQKERGRKENGQYE